MARVETLEAGKTMAVYTDQRERLQLRDLPGARYDARADHWRVPETYAHALMLRTDFRELDVEPELAERVLRAHESAQEVLGSLSSTESPDERLRPYQAAGVAFLTSTLGALAPKLLLDDVGLGKTVMVATALRLIYEEEYAETGEYPGPVLVVCPEGLKKNWERELAVWWPEARVQVVSGNITQRRKQLQAEADVFVMNYELMAKHSRLAGYGSIALTEAEREPKELNFMDFFTVVADEAHRVVNPKAKQTRALWAATEEAVVRYVMTATPVREDLGDAWALFHLADPDAWPAKTKYLDRWVEKSFNFWGGMELGDLKPERADEFRYLQSLYTLRRTQEEAGLELPPVVAQRRDVELSPKQKKSYEALRKDFLAWLDQEGEEKLLLALDPLTQATRMDQLTNANLEPYECGCGPDPECSKCHGTDTRYRMCEPSTKLDELESILEDVSPRQVVVFAESRQLIELAAARMEKKGVSHRVYTGQVDMEDKDEAVLAFQKGAARVILLTVGAGGEGLTLTAGSVLVWLQRPRSLVKDHQGTGRVRRFGQLADHILEVDVVATGTVDENRLGNLEGKRGTLEEFVQDRERLRALLQKN